MIPSIKNKEDLLRGIDNQQIFEKVIHQLNKDFQFSGISYQFISTSPKKLVVELNQQLLELINKNFQQYANLLYRIDVSELQLKKIKEIEVSKIAEKATFLVLKREFQKVWFKSKF